MQGLNQTKDESTFEELLLQLLRKESFPLGFIKDLESFAKFRTLKSEDPDFIDKIMGFLETDFYLAAQTLFTANSYKFKDRTRVENLKQAAVRVGIRTIQGFGLNYDPTVDGSHKSSTWEVLNHKLTTHSLFIALLCFYHAAVCRGKHPENCYLVGFFHEIGGVCLTKLLTQEFARNSRKASLLDSLLEGSATAELREAGNKFSPIILQKLHFPRFAIQSLIPADPKDTENNYFKKALETSHIIEECMGTHILRANNHENISPDPGKDSMSLQEGASADSDDDWDTACEKASEMIEKRFPDAPMDFSNVAKIATLTKEQLANRVKLIELRLVP